MRFVLVLSVMLACATPAFAQKEAPPAPVPVMSNASPEQLAATRSAVREVYQALMFDIGMFDQIAAVYMPQLRSSIVTSPLYINASPDRRAALDRWVDTAPNIVREEFQVEFDTMAGNVAPQIAALLNPEEVIGIANFFRDPGLRPLLDRMINQGISNGFGDVTTEPTAAETAAMEAYMLTPGGQAILNHGEAFLGIINTEMQAATPRIVARVQLRVLHGVCEALGNECPSEVRRALQPT